MAWQVINEDAGPHVVPVADTRKHITDGKCWCRPWMDGKTFVHSSDDQRERREPDARDRPSAKQ